MTIPTTKNNEREKAIGQGVNIVVVALIVGSVVFVCVAIAAWQNDEWGSFGSAFGVVTAIAALAAVLIATMTLSVQRSELAAARTAFEQSNWAARLSVYAEVQAQLLRFALDDNETARSSSTPDPARKLRNTTQANLARNKLVAIDRNLLGPSQPFDETVASDQREPVLWSELLVAESYLGLLAIKRRAYSKAAIETTVKDSVEKLSEAETSFDPLFRTRLSDIQSSLNDGLGDFRRTGSHQKLIDARNDLRTFIAETLPPGESQAG